MKILTLPLVFNGCLALLVAGFMLLAAHNAQASNLGMTATHAAASGMKSHMVQIANDPTLHTRMMGMRAKMDKMGKMMKTMAMDDAKKANLMAEMDKMDTMMNDMDATMKGMMAMIK
ncbi:MAG: hypothetical protein QM537_01295 [Candidatus Symbiobacter sp.]|nr:hypothetical protein [Candidatus Symbiobacter sp.]